MRPPRSKSLIRQRAGRIACYVPKRDLSVTKLERKRQLAELVAKRLIDLGYHATVITDHKNENGRTDRVIVKSSLGLVHTTASISTDPNGSILVSDIEGGGQDFLAGKAFVVYGWLDRSGRTMMQFIPTAQVLGRRSIPKADIIRLADKSLYCRVRSPLVSDPRLFSQPQLFRTEAVAW